MVAFIEKNLITAVETHVLEVDTLQLNDSPKYSTRAGTATNTLLGVNQSDIYNQISQSDYTQSKSLTVGNQRENHYSRATARVQVCILTGVW